MIRAAEQDRPDVQDKRAAHATGMPTLDPARLVFLDETAANTQMTRRYGRAPRGRRWLDAVPHGHRTTTTTFVAALRAAGLTSPMVTDGARNGDLFVASVGPVLVPTLRAGGLVVLDNLSSPKRVVAVRAIAAGGCSAISRPPYSPGYNPIELAFATSKARLRAAELRIVDTIERFFSTVHEAFPPEATTSATPGDTSHAS